MSWSIIAYSSYALKHDLPVGGLYNAEFSWLQGIAYLTIIGGFVFGFIACGWWGLVAVLVIGNIITRILFFTAREYTQIIAPCIVLLSVIICVVLLLRN
jgi:hypothetical protein